MNQLYAVQGGRKWHLLDDWGNVACGRAPGDASTAIPARRVLPEDRCRASGCGDAWPALLRSVG